VASQGFVTQSVDGHYLVLCGYGAAPFTSLIAFTTSVAFRRVIARVALNGTVDATTALSDTCSGGGGLPGDFLSAATVDGSAFWTAGNGAQIGNRGTCYTTLGATTSVQLTAVPNFARSVDITNGRLFVSTWFTPYVGVNTVGTGLPTTSGQTTTLLSGQPGSDATANPWDFWFADASTLYVADARTNGSGGLQRWAKTGSTWLLQYTLSPGSNIGCRSVSGVRDLGGTTLYATTTEIAGNRLVSVVDTGAGATFSTLATAATNTGFRGVRFVRTPYGVSFAGTGCATSAGVPTIGTAGGAPVAGNATFGLTCGNAPPFAPYVAIVGINQFLFPGAPLSGSGFPPCAVLYSAPDALVSGAAGALGTGVIPLSLAPPDTSLWGLPFTVQNAVYDPIFWSGVALPFGMSTGMQVIVGN
jgi:hypothetical protein